jgi:hypothetical protein
MVTDRPPKAGDRVLLAIRSERIDVRAAEAPSGSAHTDNVVSARVTSFIYVGSAYEYILETPEGQIRVATPQAIAGPEVALHLPPDAIVVLPDEPAPETSTTETRAP